MVRRKRVTRAEQAAIDLAFERGIPNPKNATGSFAWAALLPLLPLLTPLLKPVEKLIDRGRDALLDKIGLGKGFAPTGAAFTVTRPPSTIFEPSRGGMSVESAQLEVLKRKLMPYTNSPDAFKAKLMRMVDKAQGLKKA